MSAIHLFVPMLHRRDAVGEHTRSLRDLLVADGIECRIHVEHPDPDTVEETVPYREYEDTARPGDVRSGRHTQETENEQRQRGCDQNILRPRRFAAAFKQDMNWI